MALIYHEPSSQSSALRKITTHCVCNFMQNYKVTPNFTDGELGKNVLHSCKYGICFNKCRK